MSTTHNYKGYKIVKVPSEYSWRSSLYKIEGLEGYFYLLKEAKQYIDKII